MSETHRLPRTLNHQGLNFLALDQVPETRNAFLGALKMAHEGGLIPSALHALDLASQLRVELESKLPLEEIQMAKEQAKSKHLDDFTRRVLACV